MWKLAKSLAKSGKAEVDMEVKAEVVEEKEEEEKEKKEEEEENEKEENNPEKISITTLTWQVGKNPHSGDALSRGLKSVLRTYPKPILRTFQCYT